MMREYQKSKLLRIGFFFKPFSVPAYGHQLAPTDLSPDEELMIVERGGERRALLAREMAYHHVAQGELAGEAYLLSF